MEYLPNICGYISDRYSPNLPRFPEVLVAPARGINQIILAQLFHHLREFRTRIKDTQLSLTKSSDHNSIEHPIEFQFSQTNFRHHQPNKVVNSKVASLNISPENLTFVQIRDLYPHFEYSDLAKHPAIVILPYQVSFMSFFEFFRMEIPLFVPSIALLIEWQIKYNILHEKSWNSVFGRKHLKNSVILKNPNSKSKMVHDPNNDIEKSALLEWLALSDFYTFPYVTTFDSWEQLFELIVSVNLKNISSHMHVHNEKLKNDVLAKWKNYTDKLLVAKSLNPSSSSSISKSLTERREGNQILSKIDTLLANFDMALHQSYQVKLSSKCIGDSGSGSVSTLNF